MQQLLQVLLELVEVAGGDEPLPALLQAISGQLRQLMVDEAQDPVGQWADLIGGRGGEQLGQTLLHLSRRLRGGRRRGAGRGGRWLSHRRGNMGETYVSWGGDWSTCSCEEKNEHTKSFLIS